MATIQPTEGDKNMNRSNPKFKDPKNTEDNREILVEIILNDMSTKHMRQIVKDGLTGSWKASSRAFLNAYWDYYEETYGHCPFDINEPYD
jgi:hypothetical protein